MSKKLSPRVTESVFDFNLSAYPEPVDQNDEGISLQSCTAWIIESDNFVGFH